MRFEEYSIAPEIKQNLEKAGFKRPTDIQFKTIPPILKGEDVLAIAQTGTGKTAAFVIPVLNLLQNKKKNKRGNAISCLVMVPTHELALQITDVFNVLGKHTRIKSYGIFGGVDQEPQINQLEKGFDVLISTPGRLFDLVSQGHLKLQRIEILILDEADHMLDLGFIDDIRDLMKFLPKKRQTLFFSATINKKIKKLAYSLVKDAIRIQISPKDPVAKNVEHAVAHINMDDKRFFLERLIKDNPDQKFLVFVRTKVRAERVFKAMQRVNIQSETLHGNLSHKERTDTLEKYKKGIVKILIATDVSARGIDIPDVNFVINYDLPDQEEIYVHRVGRTGRGTKKGLAISFCSDEEKEILLDIEEYLNKPIEELNISKTDYRETLESSNNKQDDWKTLLKEDQEQKKKEKKRKKKKR